MSRDDSEQSTKPARTPDHPLEANAPTKATNGSAKKATAKSTALVKKEAVPAPALTPVDRAVAAIRRLKVASKVVFAINVGKAVVEHIFEGDLKEARRKGPKDKSLEELSKRTDMGISGQQLSIFVGIYDMLEREGLIEEVPTWELLGYSHLRALLPAPPKEQERLLREAHDKKWTVRDLDTEIAKVVDSKSKKGGRQRGSAVAKAVKVLSKGLERLEKAVERKKDVPEREVKSITAALERATATIAKVRKSLK